MDRKSYSQAGRVTPKKRLRFNLRTLALADAVCCVVLAVCIRPFVNEASRRLEHYRIGSDLADKGAIVAYDSGYVVRLSFNGNSLSISDIDLHEIDKLSRLREVHLPLKGIGDKTLERLQSFTQLEKLNVITSSVTDVGLAHLSRLTTLSTLILAGTGVTDAGLVHVKALRNLEQLSLDECEVTADALRDLQQTLPNTTIVQTHPVSGI